MALRASAFSHEHLLAVQLLFASLLRIEPPEWIEFRRGRKIDDVLHLRHHGHLISTVGQMHAFPCCADVVTIEVCGALFKLGEILDGTQGPLRTVNLLVEHTAEAGGVKPEALRLGTNIGCQVKRSVGVKIGVTIQAGDA